MAPRLGFGRRGERRISESRTILPGVHKRVPESMGKNPKEKFVWILRNSRSDDFCNI